MIVGSGQLASIFFGMELSNVVIFASGVSNSSNVEKTEFTREKELLMSTIEKNRDAYIIYFSSASLSAAERIPLLARTVNSLIRPSVSWAF